MKLFSKAELDEILKLPILQQFEQQKEKYHDVTIGPDYKLVFPGFKPENWTVKIVSWDKETYAVYCVLGVVYNYNTGDYITRDSNRAASIEDIEFLVKNWLDAYERKVKEVAAKKKELKKAEIELAAAEYENDI
jgi:hypothetical protein